MYKIAIKMLVGDSPKYVLLLCALTFSSLLISQQTSVFCGLMRWTTATLRNSQATIWVADANLEQIFESIPIRDIELSRVRSVHGVLWAMPYFMTPLKARLKDGTFKTIQLIGLDAATFAGAPKKLIKGEIPSLWQDKAVIIDNWGLDKLAPKKGKTIDVGDWFYINDQEATVVGVAQCEQSFFGYPFVYTTYERALEYAPKQRNMLNFILVEPRPHTDPSQVARQIEKETGLKAFTHDELFWSTTFWYIKNTGIPISFGTTVALGILVGVTVSGQTFYSFIYENSRYFAALRAIGATPSLLRKMVFLQAFSVGVSGFGLGMGLTSIFGFLVLQKGQPPFYFHPYLMLGTFIAILMICLLSALLGIRRLNKLEIASVFR